MESAADGAPLAVDKGAKTMAKLVAKSKGSTTAPNKVARAPGEKRRRRYGKLNGETDPVEIDVDEEQANSDVDDEEVGEHGDAPRKPAVNFALD